MSGHTDDRLVRAHSDPGGRIELDVPILRAQREAWEAEHLRPGAALAWAPATGRGRRSRTPNAPASSVTATGSCTPRRSAGSPARPRWWSIPTDHQRTRLTHALEVAQVATSIARGVGANVTLAEAIALGHDCGHGPGGHASEDAFDAFLADGYDHGPWGADVVLTGLNLCTQTLDGIRNHSWSRPVPATVEGEIVSWADRIAYCAHDLEDAASAGILSLDDLPAEVVAVCGRTRRQQLGAFVRAVIGTVAATGQVGMAAEPAAALAALRAFNYERIYTRPDSLAQAAAVIEVLRALVDLLLRAPRLDTQRRRDAGAGRRRRRPGSRDLRGRYDRPLRVRDRSRPARLGSGAPAPRHRPRRVGRGREYASATCLELPAWEARADRRRVPAPLLNVAHPHGPRRSHLSTSDLWEYHSCSSSSSPTWRSSASPCPTRRSVSHGLRCASTSASPPAPQDSCRRSGLRPPSWPPPSPAGSPPGSGWADCWLPAPGSPPLPSWSLPQAPASRSSW